MVIWNVGEEFSSIVVGIIVKINFHMIEGISKTYLHLFVTFYLSLLAKTIFPFYTKKGNRRKEIINNTTTKNNSAKMSHSTSFYLNITKESL